MTGTEKILQHIREEARAQADQILAAAREEAQKIADASRAECGEIAAQSDARCSAYLSEAAEKKQRSLTMERRQALLAAKGELVEEVLAGARAQILSEDASSYFDFLCSLLERQETIGNGTLLLSARDLDRLPADFPSRAARIAAEKGGSLTVSREPADIDGGLILRYEGTLENCSLDAIFASEEEVLKDMIRQRLFPAARA